MDIGSVAYQARLNVAACEYGLQRTKELRALLDKQIVGREFQEGMVGVHMLIDAAMNAIPCFIECCVSVGAGQTASLFRSAVFKGFGFDYSIEHHAGHGADEDGTEQLIEVAKGRVLQYELVLQEMLDRYVDAAERLEENAH